MKNLHEGQEKIILIEEAANDLFDKVCGTDVWQRCYTNELVVVPIDNAPILMDSIRQRLGVAKEVSDESMSECMESLNLGIKIPETNGYSCYPLGDTAFGSLIQRAGYQNAPVLSLLTAKQAQNPMSPMNKSSVLNMGFQCFKNKSLCLIRDEKVRAVLSGDESDYSILPFDELATAFKEELCSQFKEVEFSQAVASNEYFSTMYAIKDKALNNSIRDAFLKCGIDTSGMTIRCLLRSSDVGFSGANIYPYIAGKGRERMIGTPLSLTHKNQHSVADFRANVNQVMSMFKEAADKIDAMQQTKVKNPSGCLLRIAKHVGLPKKLACESAPVIEAQYGSNCYQCDIYWALYDIFDQTVEDGKLSEARKIALEEGISRIVFSNMADYDLPFQWE